jgi:circadian clock protein KaiB
VKTSARSRKAKPPAAAPPTWNLRLYVADNTPKSISAFRSLEQFCEEHLAAPYRIEVIDLPKNPQLARGDQILALPTVAPKLPAPIRKMTGTLADGQRILVGLNLRSHQATPVANRKRQ